MSEIKRAIVMVAVPGAGKTRYVETELANVKDQCIVSPDDIRGSLCRDVTDQSRNVEVWRIAYDQAEGAMLGGHALIFDATNADGPLRRQLVTHLRGVMGPEGFIKAIWLQTPLLICKKRNANRDRVVDEAEIERMHRQLQDDPPRLHEGFSQVYVPTILID